MYLPEHFREDRPLVLEAFVRNHPLGLLVTHGDQGLTADHIPMRLECENESGGTARRSLRGHVARANPLWRRTGISEDVLVIFGGADHYVTPSWYVTKTETGRVVPTWNYSTVHACGRIRFIDDAAWLHALVTALTDERESSREEPWRVSDAPPDYIETMVRAIVGFEIEVRSLVGKFKASQNRNDRDREGVRRGLEASGVPGNTASELLRARGQ